MLIDLKEVNGLVWVKPWRRVAPEERAPLARELRSELCREHVLSGRRARAVGRRDDCDDVLFLVDDPPELVVARLTYNQESKPEWPRADMFPSVGAFRDQRMNADRAEYVRSGRSKAP